MKSLSLSQPHMIIMVGVPGSGKTFFAEKFAETFHAPYVSFETIAALTQAGEEVVDNLLDYQLNELLKTRQSILVEGAVTRAHRQDLTRKAHAAGYETLLVWVQTDPATAKDRSTKRTKTSKNRILTPDEYDKAAKRFSPPTAIEKPVVISGKHTYATQAKVLLKKLSAPRAEISTHNVAPVRVEEPGRRNITIR